MRPIAPERPEDATSRRLEILESYGILDTAPEPAFDDIVLIASVLCRTPVALVSLLTDRRQWFKARTGLEACETPIGQAVCAHALRQSEPLVIPDLRLDPRTSGNPLVTGGPAIRFYAGAPLIAPDGTAVGTVCVIDTVPRPEGLEAAEVAALQALARQVVQLFEARRRVDDRDRRLVEQRRAHSAVEAGGIGTFEVDVATGTMAVSPGFCRIFGVPVEPRYPTDLIERLVVPQDRDMPSTEETRAAGTGAREVEYRIRRAADGRLRWIARRARFETDADGRVLSMVGTVQDVTDERLATLRVLALVELGETLRDAETVDAAFTAAVRCLGRTLGAARAGWGTIDGDAGALTVGQQWNAPGATALPADRPIGPLRATADALRGTGMLAVADVAHADGIAADRETYAALGIGAFIDVPLLVGGAFSGVLFVHETAPRDWTEDETGFVASIADRTFAAVARLQDERYRQTVAEEIGHRLKNTMAMVQALATQTLRGVPDRQPVETFERRLIALSRAHDVLLRDDWAGADMREVVEAAVAATGQDGRFDIAGPAVEVGPRAALSLSLVLHELTTNAVKYGALSAEAGRVAIDWAIEGDGAQAMLRFRWRESGGPRAAEPTRRGFGTSLIRSGLVGSGGVQLRFRPAGLEAEMEVLLSRAQHA